MNKKDKKCCIVWCVGLCVCEVCVRMKGMGVGGREDSLLRARVIIISTVTHTIIMMNYG